MSSQHNTMYLNRKIDRFLRDWKRDPKHLPLIVKGARQVGKTEAIRRFARSSYESVVEINFALQKEFAGLFEAGFDVGHIVRLISFIDPKVQFIPGKTLIFFDEMQLEPNAATSLKSFALDGRFDVICSGSLMGINYHEIESNSVGYKTDYVLHSLDFEEYLWALGYGEPQIEDLIEAMKRTEPLPAPVMNALLAHFRDYLVVGGMPAIVARFLETGNFGAALTMQRQILLDYKEDITKYAGGLDQTKILSCFENIPAFLGKDNKKFQISKIAKNARNRDYVGVKEWLERSGMVNICYCLDRLELPLRANKVDNCYKIYFADTGLLVGSLEDEVQQDLRRNRNLNTYKGAIYENAVADALTKQGFDLRFFRNEKSTLEMDFFVRTVDGLVPVEVKAEDDAVKSLKKLISSEKAPQIRFGIKLANRNIGFANGFYTFPYFLAFLLRRFLRDVTPAH